MRQCLWRRNTDTPKQSLAAWAMVCRPNDNGGMGIINLAVQNKALLTMNLHKFYNKADIPRVSLIWATYYNGLVPHTTVLCGSPWWRDIMKLNEIYRLHYVITINDGNSSLLWHDSWKLNGCYTPIKEKFPKLFSFALYDKISVKDFVEDFDIDTYFQQPLSHEAMDELDTLKAAI